ncbi:TATA element modulatory factor-like protein [Emericellopsis cladophorae]|uniref:TATA element modulatory factor-like protein n=1 Tax=Emericellopsis cladophorae TaxID=2686198 RepID=A0A9P9XWI8_9HYPO|nr:TATA element modulatory factor-like protein [Emericellopsis cladophorae]KAI6779035.1 TATA element modulatory factor-like protein [Emericellopsis cladophorae]
MAASGNKSSAWSTFISSAITGVESRLDNMLEGEDGNDPLQADPSPPKKQPAMQAPMSASAKAAAATPGTWRSVKTGEEDTADMAIARSSSNSRVNDRLQARLAKAMAAKGGESKASPRSSFDSRSSMDRPSLDVVNGDKKEDGLATKVDAGNSTEEHEAAVEDGKAPVDNPATSETTTSPPPPPPPPSTAAEAKAVPETTEATAAEEATPSQAETKEPAESKPSEAIPTITLPREELSSLAKDVNNMKSQHQEEIQEYVERIDSLQAKVLYLSRTAAETAKKTGSSAPANSAERKIAERDERIALLMEEGGKLSKTEGQFRTTIKRLRQQVAENEKQADALRKEKEKALMETEALKSRLDGDEERTKRQEEARKATAALQKEIDALKKEVSAKDESMKNLEQELRAKSEKAEAATVESHNKALAVEREKQKALEDTIATLKAELEEAADKARLESLEWREKLDRATERSHATETEMKNELKMMESKLEAMRSVAEEASSGSGGEGQIKLIRQIETLQSQYATASDNWQGIEASLLAKVANLEKERDEATRRESEMRKKAREAASKNRHLEDELQDLQPDLAAAKAELETAREQLAALRTSSKATETALEQARADLEKQQREVARELQRDSEKRPWPEEPLGIRNNQSRPESPLLSISRTFSSDLAGFQIPGRSRRTPVGSIPDSPLDGPRRMSSQPPGRVASGLSNVGSPQPLPTPFSPFEAPSEPTNMRSPSLAGHDDPAESKAPSSPRHVAQDMISVSTVGAGPSVQLVERMSAAIRRLEGEKVAAKEEMARICAQRDEARSDMVGLMKEIESAKGAADKVQALEKELADINGRYQTTLEMLGEKSELVEELRADVQDVKAMYRELVERTVK